MPDILHVTVPNGTAAPVWSSRNPGVSSLLFINPDLNNYVYIGSTSNITPTSPNVIPLPPNGTFSGDANANWYVTGAAAGIQPLVIVPNGQAYFLGLTQGLGNLVIPSVQSPNFETGVQGWQIAKNGDAEFNGVIVRGTFQGANYIANSNGEFFYSGTPAIGNLIISISDFSGPADPSGNNILPGVTTYEFNGFIYIATQMQGGVTTYWESATENGAWTNIGSITVQPESMLLSSSGTMQVQLGSGFIGNVPVTQSDTGVISNPNLVGANRISQIYTIPAGDLQTGTHYIIEMPFTATMESQTLELGLSIDGAIGFTANTTIGGAIVGAGVGINGMIRVHLKCITTGAGGTVNVWTDGEVSTSSAATLFTNSGALTGNPASGVALNTTVAHTIRINSLWGAAAAGQTVSGYGSECYRVGP